MLHWQDIRYAARLLARTPLFTLLTVVVLAGGLGLSIFTWSFLHTAILKPLPLDEGDRVVRLMTTTQGLGLASIDAADFAAMRGRITRLTDVGVYGDREFVIGIGENSRSIRAATVESNIFRTTRTAPALGRGFTPEDQVPGAEPVIVLSWWGWRSVFGGDSTVLNTTVRLSGVATRIIGVMPAGFGFPVAAEAWVPIDPGVLTLQTPGVGRVNAYGRLAPGVGEAEAGAELTGLFRSVRAGRPVEPGMAEPDGMKVTSYPMAQIGDEAPLVLAVLNLLATLILLLACINVTNLLLARANERARETAVRLALGAPRGRLIMQSMWESILLCLAGGVLATVFAVWLLTAVNGWAQSRLEGNLAFWWVWGFDRSVLWAAGGFVTLAIVVLGGVVATRAARTGINAVLQEGGRGGGDRREGRMARGLVVTQVAVVSLLLYFGTMSAVIAWRVVNVDFGYDTRNLLSVSVDPPAERYPDAAARGRLYQGLYDQLSLRPELTGAVLRMRLADIGDEGGEFEQVGAPPAAPLPRAHLQAVLGPLTPLGIPLADGRFFDTRDVAGAEPVALVSRAMAERYWPGRSPLGAQLRLAGLGETEPVRTVVGVVGDVLHGNPLSRDRSAIAAYVPMRQVDAPFAVIAFRHRGSEPAGRAAFHETLSALDPLLVPSNVSSFDDILAKMTVMARSVAQLFGGAFAFALLLAVSGTYGLMARSIGRRTREIGVRRALGATDRTILVMLLSQGGRQLGVGALVALPLTLLVGWGFSRYFPIGLGLSLTAAVLVSVVVTGVVLLATWVPTRRAVAVEPREALWGE